MSEAITATAPVPRLHLLKVAAGCGGALANPLLPETLAFWALWHCRHARPPDAPLARRTCF